MKTALITGASSGIGYEMALYHASRGGDVVVVARGEHKLNMLKKTIESKYAGVHCEVIPMDLTGEFAAKELMDELHTRKISVDYLINNAGMGYVDAFEKIELATLQQMVQLNVMAVMNLCHYFVKEKQASKEKGRILNVASTAAFQGIPYTTVYAATKAFVLTFSEGLAGELKGSKISVTALCPGPTKSNFGTSSNLDEKVANFVLFPSAKTVAKYGYDRMLKGDTVAVQGLMNKLGVVSTKVTPGNIIGTIAGKVFKMGIK